MAEKEMDRDNPGAGNAPAGPNPVEDLGPANEPGDDKEEVAK